MTVEKLRDLLAMLPDDLPVSCGGESVAVLALYDHELVIDGDWTYHVEEDPDEQLCEIVWQEPYLETQCQ